MKLTVSRSNPAVIIWLPCFSFKYGGALSQTEKNISILPHTNLLSLGPLHSLVLPASPMSNQVGATFFSPSLQTTLNPLVVLFLFFKISFQQSVN